MSLKQRLDKIKQDLQDIRDDAPCEGLGHGECQCNAFDQILDMLDEIVILEVETKTTDEGEGMCNECKKYTHHGLHVNGQFLCRECRK